MNVYLAVILHLVLVLASSNKEDQHHGTNDGDIEAKNKGIEPSKAYDQYEPVSLQNPLPKYYTNNWDSAKEIYSHKTLSQSPSLVSSGKAPDFYATTVQSSFADDKRETRDRSLVDDMIASDLAPVSKKKRIYDEKSTVKTRELYMDHSTFQKDIWTSAIVHKNSGDIRKTKSGELHTSFVNQVDTIHNSLETTSASDVNLVGQDDGQALSTGYMNSVMEVTSISGHRPVASDTVALSTTSTVSAESLDTFQDNSRNSQTSPVMGAIDSHRVKEAYADEDYIPVFADLTDSVQSSSIHLLANTIFSTYIPDRTPATDFQAAYSRVDQVRSPVIEMAKVTQTYTTSLASRSSADLTTYFQDYEATDLPKLLSSSPNTLSDITSHLDKSTDGKFSTSTQTLTDALSPSHVNQDPHLSKHSPTMKLSYGNSDASDTLYEIPELILSELNPSFKDQSVQLSEYLHFTTKPLTVANSIKTSSISSMSTTPVTPVISVSNVTVATSDITRNEAIVDMHNSSYNLTPNELTLGHNTGTSDIDTQIENNLPTTRSISKVNFIEQVVSSSRLNIDIFAATTQTVEQDSITAFRNFTAPSTNISHEHHTSVSVVTAHSTYPEDTSARNAPHHNIVLDQNSSVTTVSTTWTVDTSISDMSFPTDDLSVTSNPQPIIVLPNDKLLHDSEYEISKISLAKETIVRNIVESSSTSVITPNTSLTSTMLAEPDSIFLSPSASVLPSETPLSHAATTSIHSSSPDSQRIAELTVASFSFYRPVLGSSSKQFYTDHINVEPSNVHDFLLPSSDTDSFTSSVLDFSRIDISSTSTITHQPLLSSEGIREGSSPYPFATIMSITKDTMSSIKTKASTSEQSHFTHITPYRHLKKNDVASTDLDLVEKIKPTPVVAEHFVSTNEKKATSSFVPPLYSSIADYISYNETPEILLNTSPIINTQSTEIYGQFLKESLLFETSQECSFTVSKTVTMPGIIYSSYELHLPMVTTNSVSSTLELHIAKESSKTGYNDADWMNSTHSIPGTTTFTSSLTHDPDFSSATVDIESERTSTATKGITSMDTTSTRDPFSTTPTKTIDFAYSKSFDYSSPNVSTGEIHLGEDYLHPSISEEYVSLYIEHQRVHQNLSESASNINNDLQISMVYENELSTSSHTSDHSGKDINHTYSYDLSSMHVSPSSADTSVTNPTSATFILWLETSPIPDPQLNRFSTLFDADSRLSTLTTFAPSEENKSHAESSISKPFSQNKSASTSNTSHTFSTSISPTTNIQLQPSDDLDTSLDSTEQMLYTSIPTLVKTSNLAVSSEELSQDTLTLFGHLYTASTGSLHIKESSERTTFTPTFITKTVVAETKSTKSRITLHITSTSSIATSTNAFLFPLETEEESSDRGFLQTSTSLSNSLFTNDVTITTDNPFTSSNGSSADYSSESKQSLQRGLATSEIFATSTTYSKDTELSPSAQPGDSFKSANTTTDSIEGSQRTFVSSTKTSEYVEMTSTSPSRPSVAPTTKFVSSAKPPVVANLPAELLTVTVKVKANVDILGDDFIDKLSAGLCKCYEEGLSKPKITDADNKNKRGFQNTRRELSIEVKVTSVRRRSGNALVVDVDFFLRSGSGIVIESETALDVYSRLSLAETSAYLGFAVLEPITILGNERVTEEQEPPTNFMSSPLAFVMFAFISAVVVIATLVMLVLHCRLRNSVTAFPLSFWRGFLRRATLEDLDLTIDVEQGDVVRKKSSIPMTQDFYGRDGKDRSCPLNNDYLNETVLSEDSELMKVSYSEKSSVHTDRLNNANVGATTRGTVLSKTDNTEPMKSNLDRKNGHVHGLDGRAILNDQCSSYQEIEKLLKDTIFATQESAGDMPDTSKNDGDELPGYSSCAEFSDYLPSYQECLSSSTVNKHVGSVISDSDRIAENKINDQSMCCKNFGDSENLKGNWNKQSNRGSARRNCVDEGKMSPDIKHDIATNKTEKLYFKSSQEQPVPVLKHVSESCHAEIKYKPKPDNQGHSSLTLKRIVPPVNNFIEGDLEDEVFQPDDSADSVKKEQCDEDAKSECSLTNEFETLQQYCNTGYNPLLKTLDAHECGLAYAQKKKCEAQIKDGSLYAGDEFETVNFSKEENYLRQIHFIHDNQHSSKNSKMADGKPVLLTSVISPANFEHVTKMGRMSRSGESKDILPHFRKLDLHDRPIYTEEVIFRDIRFANFQSTKGDKKSGLKQDQKPSNNVVPGKAMPMVMPAGKKRENKHRVI